MNQIKCKFCRTLFTPSRVGMKFCQSNCRHSYKNRKKAYETKLAQKATDIEKLEQELIQTKLEQEKYQEQKETEKIKEKEFEEKKQRFIAEYKKMIQLSDEELFKTIYLSKIKKESDPNEKAYLYDHIRFGDKEFKRYEAEEYRRKKREIYQQLTQKEDNLIAPYPFFISDPKIESFENKIESLQKQIENLEQTEIKLNLPTNPDEAKIDLEDNKNKKRRFELNQKNIPSKELGGGEVRRMKFDTYCLSGELGRFLGELDNNMVAFALTGDSGAGKSYFSYQLAKLFLVDNKTVKYFSLEEGIGKLTRDKLDIFQIGNEMKITASGTIDDVDRDAKKYDVIIVDSFSKIAKDQKAFDWLRQRHPKTVFIMIFQKTTAKTMLGGAGIKYDSSATINVKYQNGERVAIMEKGRYGTQNWVYSISRDEVISMG